MQEGKFMVFTHSTGKTDGTVKQTDAGIISVISLLEAVPGFGSACSGCQFLKMRTCFVLAEHHSPSLGL